MNILLQVGEAIAIAQNADTLSNWQWVMLVIIILLLLTSSFLMMILLNQRKTNELWRKEKEIQIRDMGMKMEKFELEVEIIKKKSSEIAMDYEKLGDKLELFKTSIEDKVQSSANDLSYIRGILENSKSSSK